MAEVKTFFDKNTFTLTYCLFDTVSKEAVIIDPVLDFDPVNCKVSKEAVSELMAFIHAEGLKPKYVLETHIHADHWTSARVLKEIYPEIKVGVSRRIGEVAQVFSYLFAGQHQPNPQSDFDLLIKENDEIKCAGFSLKVVETPGHTPCCLSFVGDGRVFVGDLLFMPDGGCGRCDFPGGDAALMYDSIQNKIFNLPDDYLVYTGHDYQPGGRELKYSATVQEHKKSNIRITAAMKKDEFIKLRQEIDAKLNLPKLIFSSLQINITSGRLPQPAEDGHRILALPFWEG